MHGVAGQLHCQQLLWHRPALIKASLYGLGGYNSVAVDANENLYAMDPVNSRAIVFPNAEFAFGQSYRNRGFRTGSVRNFIRAVRKSTE